MNGTEAHISVIVDENDTNHIDEAYYQKGYTYEACKAVLEQHQEVARVMAIVSFENQASIKLLNKLGFSVIDENLTDFPDTYLLSYTRV